VELPSFPIITTELEPCIYEAMRAWAVYSVSASGIRARREATMQAKRLEVGIDAAALEDADGKRCVVENFAREVDLDVVGLNGWDGSANLSPDIWAFLWLIAKDPGELKIADQWAFLASPSNNAPALPAGWTHKRLVSAARIESDGGSNWQIAPFRHSGGLYEYSGRRLVAVYSAVRIQAAQSLATAIPPGIELAEISLLSAVTSGSLQIMAFTTGAANPMWSAWAATGKRGEAAGPVYCPNQSIDTSVTISGTATGSLFVTGFRWPENVEP